ncbi:acyl-CoA thioesterase [Engelhardtia mirabilis]|uniref:acyl-CoA thioesterase n=1 Tax=Engelhardtia mirabilis TaxID=2528011 RepID=UPI003AF3BA49
MQTRWVDEDNQQVLNNAIYLTLLEEARLRYFRGLELMDGARFPFVLAQCNLRFLRPGCGGAEVVVAVRTTHLGSSSFSQSYRMGPQGEEPWAEAEALLVAWDNKARAKRPMTSAFRSAVARFEGLAESR